jgi:outer membrane receptor protein involved in Fe transport
LASTRASAAEVDCRLVTVDIPRGAPLEVALIGLAQKAELLLSAPALSGYASPPLKGTFTLSRALALLLQGSAFDFKVVGKTIYVMDKVPGVSGTAGTPRVPVRPSSKGARPQRGAGGSRSADEEPPEVIVVGTHISGGEGPSPVRVLDRTFLEATGFQTLGEAVRSLPLDFAGGPNPGVISAGGIQNATSESGASTANLLGLGPASTLTLLDGHRVAATEASGAFDLSLIPISAVERIEIATGGASAVYGSDAVAGVVNIVLRDSYEGVEISGAEGVATEGGGALQHYSSIAGYVSSDASVMAVGDCTRQQGIDSRQRSYLPDTTPGITLLPETRSCSMVLKAWRDLPSNIDVNILGAYTSRSSDRTDTLDSGSATYVASTVADVRQYALAGFVRVPLGGTWTGVFSADLSADNIASQEVLSFSDGGYLRSGNPFDNQIRSIEGYASGTLLQLRSGALKAALGGGDEEEDSVFGTLPLSLSTAASRHASFAFAEAAIPLLATRYSENTSALEMSIAARFERYSDVGTTSNPKVGILYTLPRDFRLSASWGSSFRAPSLSQQYSPARSSLQMIPDPSAVTGQSLALVRFGGNPGLRPEISDDMTVDVRFSPAALPGTSVELSYYDILYRRRIGSPTGNTGNPLSDGNVTPFVTRNPGTAEIAQIVSQSQFQDLTGGRYPALDATVIIDDRNQNITRQRASGFDLLSQYSLESPIGRLAATADLTFLRLRQQVTTASPLVPLSGNVFYPPSWRGRAGVSWDRARFHGALFANYTDHTRNPASAGQPHVASWTTFDGQIRYSTGASLNTNVSLSVRNLLDRHPPLVSPGVVGLGSVGFDSTNASATGRFLATEVAVRW